MRQKKSCSEPEPIPVHYRKPGDLIYSPGYSETYVVVSYPFCRLYHDPAAKFPLQPFDTEFNPYGANYLSYEVVTVSNRFRRFIVTDLKLIPA